MVLQSKSVTAALAMLGILFASSVSAQSADIAACDDLRRQINTLTDRYYEGGQKRQMAVWQKLRVDAIGRFKYLQCNDVLLAQNSPGPGNSVVQDETVREILAAMDSGDDLSEALPATAAGSEPLAQDPSTTRTLAQRVADRRVEAIRRTGRAPTSNGWGQGF